METFAWLLDQLLSQRVLRVDKFAEEAGVSASYISNLRRPATRLRRPSHETLRRLVDAFLAKEVPEHDIRRLVEAAGYTWTFFRRSQQFPLLDMLRHGVETRGIVSGETGISTGRGREGQEGPQERQRGRKLDHGDLRVFLQQVTALLHESARATAMTEKRRIYLSGLASLRRNEAEVGDAQEDFVEALRHLLGANSPWEVWHLWPGQGEETFRMVGDALTKFLGTSRYYLYEVPGGAWLPDFLLIEDLGALLALPNPRGQYAIFSLVGGKARQEYLAALVEYVEALLGPEDARQPILQTLIAEAYSLRDLEQLALAEEQDARDERLLVTSGFSGVFRPELAMREWLQVENVKPEKIEEYLRFHRRRVAALQQRLTVGKERIIHAREALKSRFQHLADLLVAAGNDGLPGRRARAEADVRQGQILEMLKYLHNNAPSALGLDESLGDLLKRRSPFFEVVGHMAFIQFQMQPHDVLGKEPSGMAWTYHPGILAQLRSEFDAWWQAIPSEWRTDTAEGKRKVMDWIVAESLKALLWANVPPGEFWAFAGQMIPLVLSHPEDNFFQELISHEQAASRILLINCEFPVSTMPVSVGPWPGKSIHRTRQRLLYSILTEGKEFKILVSGVGINRYRDEYVYGNAAEPFSPEETQRHIAHIQTLIDDNSKQIDIEVVSSIDFPVNFEVIDDEVVFIETAHHGSPGGLILEEKELAQAIRQYAAQLETAPVGQWLASQPEKLF